MSSSVGGRGSVAFPFLQNCCGPSRDNMEDLSSLRDLMEIVRPGLSNMGVVACDPPYLASLLPCMMFRKL